MDFLNHLSVDLSDNEVTGGFEWLNGENNGVYLLNCALNVSFFASASEPLMPK